MVSVTSQTTNRLRIFVSLSDPSSYTVWSPQCKMLSLDPHEEDVMKFFSKQNAISCSTKRPLTSIEHNIDDDRVRLILHTELKSEYFLHLVCCYQQIFRAGLNETADVEFRCGVFYFKCCLIYSVFLAVYQSVNILMSQ